MPEVNRRWIYPTVTASENKGIERIALSGEGLSHEVVGIDGSRRFGCRPSSGFRLAHTLNFTQSFQGSNPNAADAVRPFSGVAPPAMTTQGTVTDCFPVHFQIREGEFGHGFVYRVKPSGSASGAIYMDYTPTNTVDSATGWRTVLISNHATAAGGHIPIASKMDVVSMGKYVITFVKGRQPRVFYIDFDGTSTYTHQVVPGGPGKEPRLKNETSDSPAFVVDNGSGANGRSSNVSSNPTPIAVILTPAGPKSSGSNREEKFHQFKVGDYSFAYYLHDSHTGRRTPLSKIAQRSQDGPVMTANDCVRIATEVDTSKFDQIYIFRSVKMQNVGSTYSGSVLHLDTIYNIDEAVAENNAEYLGITELASNNNSNYTNTNYKVFSCTYQLDDIGLAMQDVYLDRINCDEKMPFVGAATAFEGSLITSDPEGEIDTLATDLDQRIRDIGEIRWSSLTERSPELFPVNNKYTPDIFQNRVIRLARAGDYAIGFSKDRLYHIRRNGIYLKIEDLHSGFGLSGIDAYATAGPVVYFVTSKGLKAIANNGQLDDVKALDNLLLEDWYDDLSSIRLSYDSYASCLFVHNPVKEQTVAMWFSTGRVTEFHDMNFDDIRSGIWQKDYTRNSFDNTTPVPTTASDMVERSFFLQNHPDPSSPANIPAGWRPRVYILDTDRDKVAVNSTDLTAGTDKVLRTLDCGGDSVFTVKSVTIATPNNTVILKSGLSTTKELGADPTEGSAALDLCGAYVYVVSSTDQTKVGQKFQILKASGGTITADGTYGGSGTRSLITPRGNVSTNLIEGDVLALSPMFFRYVGGALPMIRTKDNQVVSSMDLFQNKQVSSLGCHFSDVGGGVTGYKFFRGLVYNTQSDSPAVSAFPADFSGSIIGDSVKNGESDDYAAFTASGLTTTGRHGIQDSALNPGLEIFCPDLDYKLMALICRGRTTNTDTSERNT